MLIRLTARARVVALTFAVLAFAAGAAYVGRAHAGTKSGGGPTQHAFFVGGTGGPVSLPASGVTYAGVSSQSPTYDDVEQVLAARLTVGAFYCRQEYPTATATTVTLEINFAAASPSCTIAAGTVVGSTPLNINLVPGWSIGVKIETSSPGIGTLTWSLGP